jgi:hypothetical protein
MRTACACFAIISMASFAAGVEVPNRQSFATPEQALEAFAAAVTDGAMKNLQAMLGPEAKAILDSGDAIADKETRERFSAAYAESHKLEPRGSSTVRIVVGRDDWPLPIPLVQRNGGWYFDTEAGRQELLNRRIGRNELSVIQAVLAYVDAQREYYLLNPENDTLLHYAQKFVSSPGERDGLYFPTKDSEKSSPLGPLFNVRRAAGYVHSDGGKPQPYHGYYYRILKGQGSHAPGGAYNYVVRGKMIGGFALLAYPATYGNSGVMTFMVNHDGVVYEKNFGWGTPARVTTISRFDPDRTWNRASTTSTSDANRSATTKLGVQTAAGATPATDTNRE